MEILVRLAAGRTRERRVYLKYTQCVFFLYKRANFTWNKVHLPMCYMHNVSNEENVKDVIDEI